MWPPRRLSLTLKRPIVESEFDSIISSPPPYSRKRELKAIPITSSPPPQTQHNEGEQETEVDSAPTPAPELSDPFSLRGTCLLLLRVLLLFSPEQQDYLARLFNFPKSLERQFLRSELLSNCSLFSARLFSLTILTLNVIFDSIYYFNVLPTPMKGHWIFPASFFISLVCFVLWNLITCLGANPFSRRRSSTATTSTTTTSKSPYHWKWNFLRRHVCLGELVILCLPVSYLAMAGLNVMFDFRGMLRIQSICLTFVLGHSAISILPSGAILVFVPLVLRLVAILHSTAEIPWIFACMQLLLQVGIGGIGLLTLFSLQSVIRAAFVSRFGVSRAITMCDREHRRVEVLLRSLLPVSIASEILERTGDVCVHRHNPNAVFVFVRVVDFESFVQSKVFSATDMVRILNRLFLRFDKCIAPYLLRLKTAFETYIFCAGLPEKVAGQSHLALAMNAAFQILRRRPVDFIDASRKVNLQIGLASGDVVSGVLSSEFPQYDSWGLALNVSSRLSTARTTEGDSLYNGVHVTNDIWERLDHDNYAVRSFEESQPSGGHLCRLKGVGGCSSSQDSDVRQCYLLVMQRDPERPNQRDMDIVLDEDGGMVIEEEEEEEGEDDSDHQQQVERMSSYSSGTTSSFNTIRMNEDFVRGFVDVAMDIPEDNQEIGEWFHANLREDPFEVPEDAVVDAFFNSDQVQDEGLVRANTAAAGCGRQGTCDVSLLTLGLKGQRLAKLNAHFWNTRFRMSVGLNRAIFIVAFVFFVIPLLTWETYYAACDSTSALLDQLLYRTIPWMCASQLAILLLYLPFYTLHWIPFTILSVVAYVMIVGVDLATRDTDMPLVAYQPLRKVANYIHLLTISALGGVHFYVKSAMLVGFVVSLFGIYLARYNYIVAFLRVVGDSVFVGYCGYVCLQRHLRDLQNVYQQALGIWKMKLANEERDKSMNVLLSVLPRHVVRTLLEEDDLSSGRMIGESYELVGLVAADLVGFTVLAASISSYELITLLNRCFSLLYSYCDRRQIQKVTVLGDMFIAVSGCPNESSRLHLLRLADVALEIADYSGGGGDEAEAGKGKINPDNLALRISLTAGPIIAGVVLGSRRSLNWDIYGSSVKELLDYNNRSESGKILCSHVFYKALHAQVQRRRNLQYLRTHYHFEETTEKAIETDKCAFWLRRKRHEESAGEQIQEEGAEAFGRVDVV